MCRFEIRVKRVYKDVMEAFPNRLYGRQITEKQHSWPPRLSGIINSFKLTRGCACTYANKNKSSFEALPGEFVSENAKDKL